MSSGVTYKTVEGQSEGLYKEKGSKFIAYAVSCTNEDDVKQHLANWRKMHHQARHVCYAYRLGADKKVFRANDDGEPNNSAGTPILGQIQSFDLTNVLVGVVRYFGGTKLGVGGLVQAYKTAAREALENALIVEKELREQYVLSFRYEHLPAVMSFVKSSGFNVQSTRFDNDCEVDLDAPFGSLDFIEKNLNGVEISLKGLS